MEVQYIFDSIFNKLKLLEKKSVGDAFTNQDWLDINCIRTDLEILHAWIEYKTTKYPNN